MTPYGFTRNAVEEEMVELARDGREPRLILVTQSQLDNFRTAPEAVALYSVLEPDREELFGLPIELVNSPPDRFVLDSEQAGEFWDRRRALQNNK